MGSCVCRRTSASKIVRKGGRSAQGQQAGTRLSRAREAAMPKRWPLSILRKRCRDRKVRSSLLSGGFGSGAVISASRRWLQGPVSGAPLSGRAGREGAISRCFRRCPVLGLWPDDRNWRTSASTDISMMSGAYPKAPGSNQSVRTDRAALQHVPLEHIRRLGPTAGRRLELTAAAGIRSSRR